MYLLFIFYQWELVLKGEIILLKETVQSLIVFATMKGSALNKIAGMVYMEVVSLKKRTLTVLQCTQHVPGQDCGR